MNNTRSGETEKWLHGAECDITRFKCHPARYLSFGIKSTGIQPNGCQHVWRRCGRSASSRRPGHGDISPARNARQNDFPRYRVSRRARKVGTGRSRKAKYRETGERSEADSGTGELASLDSLTVVRTWIHWWSRQNDRYLCRNPAHYGQLRARWSHIFEVCPTNMTDCNLRESKLRLRRPAGNVAASLHAGPAVKTSLGFVAWLLTIAVACCQHPVPRADAL